MARLTSLKLRHIQLLLCTLYTSWFIFGLFSQSFVDIFSLPFSSKQEIYKLFTFHLVTDESFVFLMTLVAFFIYTKLVLDSWSTTEVVFYYWLVNVATVIVSLYPLVLQLFNFTVSVSRINGASAFVSSVLVVLIQLRPDQPVISCKGFSIVSRYALLLVLAAYFIAAIIGLVRFTSLALFFNGMLFSWFYLRFCQRHPQGRRGDHGSSFAFARLFPEPIATIVSIPTNMCYQVLLRTKLFPALRREGEITVTSSFGIVTHGAITPDSERHRRIALKALNERFMKKENLMTTSNELVTTWPSLMDSDETQKSGENASKESSVIVNLPTDTSSSNSTLTDSQNV
ncbi:unnamed protein product [Trichobilharzia szidati]|nr:unnamed protein product [Trichobilharzia szidati]